MPICTRCGKGYDGAERVCPSCGAPPGVTSSRCGPVAMLAMRIAWGAAFVAAIVCLLGGIIVVIRGEWLAGVVRIFIMAPTRLRPTCSAWHGV